MITDYVNPTENEIIEYQKRLGLLLKISNVSHRELGDLIGLTRAQIYNICNMYCNMSKTKYIAINVTLEVLFGEEKYKKLINITNQLYEEL